MIINKPAKIELLVFLIALAIAGIGIYYLGPSITGFVVKEYSYTDDLNLVVTSSGNYTWQVANIGDLKSLKLNGRITTYGRARVYLESNGAKYLVFDSTRLNESTGTSGSSNLITGFAVKGDEEKKKNNKKPEWTSGIGQFVINSTATINLSEHFTDKDYDLLVYSVSEAEGITTLINNEIVTITATVDKSFNTTITFTASDGIDSKSNIVDLIVDVNTTADLIPIADNTSINLTITNQSINTTPALNETINITPVLNETQIINETQNLTQITANKTIAISLAYKSGTIYDANDNGEESVNGVVDLTVEDTKFNWDVDQSKLCTRWEVYNPEDATLTKFCNGNSDCCAFVDLLPSNNNWSEAYYSVFGKDGAGYNNVISSQVIYYDVNLSIDNPKSEIYYSEWSNLSVKFFEEEIEFKDVCLETCSLEGLNKSYYTLLFEIEDNSILRIDTAAYSVLAGVENNAPLLLKNFSTINLSKNKNIMMNLSEYFADPDGDILSYSYYKPDNITILFENNTATILPDKDFEGTRFTYITANDSESFVNSNVFGINVLPVLFNLPTINTTFGSFEIRNRSDSRIAVFDSFGNLNIKGFAIQNTGPIADADDFAVQNSTNGLNAVITNPEGNLLLKGSLIESQEILNTTPNSFIIQDRNAQTVAYINSTGSLFLKGNLTENVLFD